MVKDLTNFFKNGDITPKERALLFVKDYVEFEKTGKHPLSESDRHALNEGWKPKDNYEVDEYNRYYEAWRMFNFSELDAQTTYLKGQNNYLTLMRLVDVINTIVKATEYDKDENTLDNYLFRRETTPLENLDDLIKTKKDPLKFMISNSGLSYDYTVYRLAFENLSNADKKYFTDELYGDIKTDSTFLDQQENIAGLLDDKGKITESGKKKLAELIAKTPYNRFAGEYQLYHYYANIPVKTIVEGWADAKGIDYAPTDKDIKEVKEKNPTIDKIYDTVKDKLAKGEGIASYTKETKLVEAIRDFAKKHNTTVEEIIKAHAIKAIDEGLLDYHKPLVACETALYKRWIKEKTNAKTKVDKLVESGELKTETVKNEITGMTQETYTTTEIMITGDSLFNFKGDFKPANEYKEQIQHYKFLGGLILLLRESPFLKDYGKLVGFLSVFKRLSRVFEVDLTAKTNGWVKDFEDSIKELNRELVRIKEGVDFMSYSKHSPNFFVSFNHAFYGENYLVDLDKASPNQPSADYYESEFKRLLGNEF